MAPPASTSLRQGSMAWAGHKSAPTHSVRHEAHAACTLEPEEAAIVAGYLLKMKRQLCRAIRELEGGKIGRRAARFRPTAPT